MATYIFGEGPGGDASGNHKDTYLDNGLMGGDDSYASNAEMVAIDDGLLGQHQYPLMRFDISAIGAGETVTSATLRLYTSIAPLLADNDVDVHAMTTAWGVTDTDEGVDESPATGGQATYNEAKDTNGVGDTHWAAGAGNPFGAGDYRAAVEDTETWEAGEAVGTAHDIDITALVAEWYAGTLANHGIVLIPENGAEGIGVDSQSSGTAAERPSLTVVTSGAPAVSTSRKKSRLYIGVGVGI